MNKIYAVCGTPSTEPPPANLAPSAASQLNYWPGVKNLKYFAQFTPKPQKRTLRSMFSSQRSQHAVDLLDKLLTLNPSERLSAEQALDHEYFFEEPLALEPHQHPNFTGNHHEFGSKQRRRNPQPTQTQTGAAAAQNKGGYNNQPQQAAASSSAAGGYNNAYPSQQQGGGGGQNYHRNPRGPAPFDRMQVSSHEQFGGGGFNQPAGATQQQQGQRQNYQQGHQYGGQQQQGGRYGH